MKKSSDKHFWWLKSFRRGGEYDIVWMEIESVLLNVWHEYE